MSEENNDKFDKRFIEVTFPVREVSEASAREKNIRYGHISTLHVWWARRPLASSRATIYAALIPSPKTKEELEERKKLIAKLAKWENSLNEKLIKKAKSEILKAFSGTSPKVLDPFAGGGSIPLEALRLGCETYAGDYNPVAIFILKATLEFPLKYGDTLNENDICNHIFSPQKYSLIDDVEKWGNWVLQKAKKELEAYYPKDTDGSAPVGYIWVRTIPCQNPSCNIEIPLMRQFWLANKPNKKIAIYPYVKEKKIHFKLVGTGFEPIPKEFDPSKGTVSRGIAVCPICGSTIDSKTVKRLFREGKSNQRMIAVILHKKGGIGKKYRIATQKDIEAYLNAKKHLKVKRAQFIEKWGIDPIPNEEIPPKETHRAVGSQLPLYNFKVWGDLFNDRQKLSLIVLVEQIREAYEKMIKIGLDRQYAKIITSYLALGLSKVADRNNTISTYAPSIESFVNTFGRSALRMTWEYPEIAPIFESVGYKTAIKTIVGVLKNLKVSANNRNAVQITQLSATNLPYPDEYFDAIFTDPPYYDNVPYAYLSDFFYVWLKRIVNNIYPELFATHLTPKSKEIVAYPKKMGGKDSAMVFFETMLKKSFREIYRVLKENGIAVIVYAHKTTAGWETVINALLESGLNITASWPIHTERKRRLNAIETASLASSIYIIARKIKKAGVGFYPEIKDKLVRYLKTKLENLWQDGISGPDFFIAAIGSAIEVFGKYEKVIDYEGNQIRADRLLNDVRKIVTDFAIKQILQDGFSGEVTPLTRFYILWRWNFGEAKVHFDEARKLAQSVGIDLENEWNGGFIKKEKEFIRVLGPHQRDLDDLENSTQLIDVLHYVLRLWEMGAKDRIKVILASTGYGKSDVFYRVAQAISETLPMDSKEKKLLDGFLSGKECIKSDLIKKDKQQDLGRWIK